jgi:5'-nucleotidase
MGHRHYTANEVERRHDPSGRPYYWLGGAQPVDEDDLETDVGAVKAGYVSVTPISLDLTDRRFLPQLREWALFAAALPTGGTG